LWEIWKICSWIQSNQDPSTQQHVNDTSKIAIYCNTLWLGINKELRDHIHGTEYTMDTIGINTAGKLDNGDDQTITQEIGRVYQTRVHTMS